MKKSICICFSILLFMSLMPMVSMAAPLMKNGDFESVTASGYFTSWSTSLSTVGLVGENAYHGNACVRLSSTENFALVGQNIAGISENETYILQFAFRPETSAFYPFVTLTYYDGNGNSVVGDKHLSTAADWGTKPTKNAWNLYNTTLSVPEGATTISVRLRTREAGSVCCYDFVSLTKPIIEETGTSLLLNGTFENTPDGDWKSQSGKWTDNFAYLKSGGYNNSACVRISSPENAAYPYVDQYVKNVLPGAEYKVSLLLKTEKITNFVRFKCEFYKTAGGVREGKGECTSGDMTGPEGKWVQYTETFTVPQDADTVRLMLRIYGGTGTVYFDNVGLYLAKEPPRGIVETDKVFYYTGAEKGQAKITLNSCFSETYTAFSATLFRENKVIGTVPKTAMAESFSFPLVGMTEGTAHKLGVTLYNAAGKEYPLPETEIYMFPRPKNIGADNVWREEDGTVFHPVFAYHMPETAFSKAKEAGINLVQAYGATSSLTRLLDSAAANGIKVLVPLYANGNFAGDEAQRQATLQTVRTVKNHPALFGYMIADEPYYVSHTSDIDERLKKSYLTVKEEDTVHPVFLNESSVVPHFFDDAVKYADVFCIDPYIGGDRDAASYVAEKTAQAVKAAKGEKPVYILLQTFLYGGNFPTGDELRHQIYQAFANGAMGIGYYKYDNAMEGKSLCDTPIWQTLKSMAKEEIPFLFDSFVTDKANLTKVKDGVYSRKTAEGTYTIVFGSAESGAYTETIDTENTADVFGGLTESNFVFSEGKVTLSLRPYAAGYYRLYKSDSVVFYKNGSPVRKLTDGTYTAVGNFEKLYIAVYNETSFGMDLISFHIGKDGETEFTVRNGSLLKAMILSEDLSPQTKAITLQD